MCTLLHIDPPDDPSEPLIAFGESSCSLHSSKMTFWIYGDSDDIVSDVRESHWLALLVCYNICSYMYMYLDLQWMPVLTYDRSPLKSIGAVKTNQRRAALDKNLAMLSET